uniref:RxLR effector protein n=1 Tax=Peronospora matthiolae TaxID=2874970 RepID=A0AAV1VGU8_9STRA
MRLLHALLLPGVIVFASKVKSIQAYTLLHAGKDVPDDDSYQSGTAATGNGEERDMSSLSKTLKNVIRRMFPASKTTRSMWEAQGATGKAKGLANIAAKKAKVEQQLTKKLESLMAQRQHDGKPPGAFFDSPEYNQMVGFIHKANLGLPPKNALRPVEFIFDKLDPKDQILMIEATTKNADRDAAKLGFQLLGAYMRKNFKPPHA